MSERGVLAMTPGEALDMALRSLQVDLSRVESFKSWTERPESLDAFSPDAQWQDCIGAGKSVKDAWERRHAS